MSDEKDYEFIYLSYDDFLKNKNSKNYDEVEFSFSDNDVDLDFYKPGFDLAFILLDKSLYNKIGRLQQIFQSNLGFTTHCVLVQDRSKIRNLIKDLKMNNTVYAVVIDVNYEDKDSYDVYVLYPYIEVQIQLIFTEMYELIKEDYEKQKLGRLNLMRQDSRLPHEKHVNDDGFVTMTPDLRHLFCLLYDGRMLTMDELKNVKNYLLVRRKALINAEPFGLVKYNRPVERMRQNPTKYALYDPINLDRDNRSLLALPPSQNEHQSVRQQTTVDHQQIRQQSIIDHQQIRQQQPIIDHQPIRQQPIIDHQPIRQQQATVVISKEPTLYSNNNVSPVQIQSSPSNQQPRIQSTQSLRPIVTQNKPLLPPPPPMPASKVHPFAHRTNKETTPNKNISPNKESTNNDLVRQDSKHKIRFTISNQKEDEDIKITKSTSLETSPSKRKIEDVDQRSPAKLPKLSNESLEVTTIDLIDNGDVIDDENEIEIDDEDEDDEFMIISSTEIINLFKLVLELSILNLPDNNIVTRQLQKSCEFIQSRIPDDNLKQIHIDAEDCKNEGFIELINDIYQLTDSLSPNYSVFAELDYLWTQLFPQKISDNDMLVLFYRFIKLLIPFKAFNQHQDTMDCISDLIRKLSSRICFNFQSAEFTAEGAAGGASSSNRNTAKFKTQLNALPQLFPLYLKQANEFHNHSNFQSTTTSSSKKQQLRPMSKCDLMVLNTKIKFHVYPVFKYLFDVLNSLTHFLSLDQVKVIYDCIRTLRYCLRKTCSDIISSSLEKPIVFSNESNMKKNFDALVNEVQTLVLEITKYRPVIFSEKHYEFINLILDCSLKIEQEQKGLSSTSSSSLSSPIDYSWINKQSDKVFDYSLSDFIEQFITYKTSVVLGYHPETELSILRRVLRDHWKPLLFRAIRSSTSGAAVPDGSRISCEINTLLPSIWRDYTFSDAVSGAVKLYMKEWEKLARVDTKNSMIMFQQSRFDGLMWFQKNNLPMLKILEEMASTNKKLDQLFLENLNSSD